MNDVGSASLKEGLAGLAARHGGVALGNGLKKATGAAAHKQTEDDSITVSPQAGLIYTVIQNRKQTGTQLRRACHLNTIA